MLAVAVVLLLLLLVLLWSECCCGQSQYSRAMKKRRSGSFAAEDFGFNLSGWVGSFLPFAVHLVEMSEGRSSLLYGELCLQLLPATSTMRLFPSPSPVVTGSQAAGAGVGAVAGGGRPPRTPGDGRERVYLCEERG